MSKEQRKSEAGVAAITISPRTGTVLVGGIATSDRAAQQMINRVGEDFGAPTIGLIATPKEETGRSSFGFSGSWAGSTWQPASPFFRRKEEANLN